MEKIAKASEHIKPRLFEGIGQGKNWQGHARKGCGV